MMTISVYRVRPDGTRVRVLPRTTVAPRDPERPPPPLSFPPCRCARCLPLPHDGGSPAPSRPMPPTPVLAKGTAKDLARKAARDMAKESAKEAASARAVIDAET